jgi:trk system potassium uptake protein TrkH
MIAVQKATNRGIREPLTLTLIILAVGLTALFLERLPGRHMSSVVLAIDIAIVGLLVLEQILATRVYPTIRGYLKTHRGALVFLGLYIPLFLYTKVAIASELSEKLPAIAVVLRSIVVVLRIASRLNRLSGYLRRISIHPAQTVTLSFVAVIVSGTVFLMQPFATLDGQGLSVINALFTATSAVCVTGLIVVDTATAFTFWGWLIILVLIQAGGLGIMILSYFAVFTVRRGLSLDERVLISFMLSERDMSNLRASVRRIVTITFAIEAVGAALLLARLADFTPEGQDPVFYAIFHSVSAFCNAGFSLFTTSLEAFRSDPLVSFTVAALIILGGISFAVLTDTSSFLFRSLFRRVDRSSVRPKLAVNTRVVLIGTVALLISGTFFVYALEHHRTISGETLGTQYLAAFFQSTTLRTAGFNTIDFSAVGVTTLLMMAVYMFIGGAAGSTAGGIKVNSAAVVGAHLRSTLRDREEVTLFDHAIPSQVVTKSLMIVVFGVVAVTAGTVALSLSESASLEKVLFEVVSAFGTVGLSTGITSSLSVFGRCVIIILMFVGRIGPLTLLAAAAWRTGTQRVRYAQAEVMIG